MRVVIAPDSFKECASAAAVAKALSVGWRRVFADAEIICVPMADGGEGTVDALIAATGGTEIAVQVTDPLGKPVVAKYGFLGDGATAVIEMAAASGLPRVPPEERDPRVTTTYGTGELLRDALDRGAKRIILGIGGSATNDGGAGMAQALGFSLLDGDGLELPRGGAALARLARIDLRKKHARLEECRILVACDVTNPLCGPQGASLVYGPQKGATEAVALQLDVALEHYGRVLERQLGVSVVELPGAGAAGGLGAGLVAFAGAQLRPGVELVAEACGLAGRMEGANLIITGEGRLDGQTAHGKTPAGVARIAKRQGIPVIAVAGALGAGYEELYEHGIDAVFSICQGPIGLPEAIERVEELLASAAESIARLWKAAGTGSVAADTAESPFEGG
jgi:glycerate kinase